MKWQAALSIALSAVSAALAASSQEMPRASNLAVPTAHASQPSVAASSQQARGTNSGSAAALASDHGKAVQPDHDKNGSKGGGSSNRPTASHNEDAKGSSSSSSSSGSKSAKDSKGSSGDGDGDGNDGGDGEKKGGSSKSPTKTHKKVSDDTGDDEEAEKEYLKRIKADKDAGKLPGRMKMIVPPRTVHTPLFELDSVVELSWDYDNNVIEVPEKLMISVQLPKDPHAGPGTKPILYDIAVNITGNKKKFYWDTKNDVPDGVGMREGSGYTMYFYDGEIGFRMSDVVPAGYLIKYAMPFAFFISRYERTNDGVPKNYNPNSASRPAPALGLTMLLLLAISAALSIRG